MKKYVIKGVDTFDHRENVKNLTHDFALNGEETMIVSDGYHTMDELYEHRIALWIKVCKFYYFLNILAPRVSKKDTISVSTKPEDQPNPRDIFVVENLPVWRSKLHDDGSEFEGWFILGIGKEKGKIMTYHLPNIKWDEVSFAETLDRAPEFDGHTAADVLERLKTL